MKKTIEFYQTVLASMKKHNMEVIKIGIEEKLEQGSLKLKSDEPIEPELEEGSFNADIAAALKLVLNS